MREAYAVHFGLAVPPWGAGGGNAGSNSVWGQTRKIRQAGPGGNGPARVSVVAAAGVISHERGDAVEHVLQAAVKFPGPAILGQSCRQAVHGRETPGVNPIRRI